MFKSILFFLLVFVFSLAAFAQNKSVYTDLSAEKCKTTDVDKGMPGNYSGKCKGVGGYDLEVNLDDERNSIGVVLPSKKTVGLEFWHYFSNFSALGEKAEWRVKDEIPVALIVRLNVSDRGDEKPPTSYLIVSKISATGACVTDIVKLGKNQNAQAQRLADKASTKPCKKIHESEQGAAQIRGDATLLIQSLRQFGAVHETERGITVTLPENLWLNSREMNFAQTADEKIANLASALANNPDYRLIIYRLIIESHTDNKGSASELQSLTDERARLLSEKLDYYGIKQSHIEARGMGATVPVASNATPANRAKNRRTEITLVVADNPVRQPAQ